MSASVRNSYTIIMCSYEEWATCLSGILFNFLEDPTKVRWTFSIRTHASWPVWQGGIYFSLIIFFFTFLFQFLLFLPCMVFKTRMPLTALHYHAILIENVCRVLCKRMLPAISIKLCVTLKHIHLAYVRVEKITSNVNTALW